jgi:ATP-dependent Lon protease
MNSKSNRNDNIEEDQNFDEMESEQEQEEQQQENKNVNKKRKSTKKSKKQKEESEDEEMEEVHHLSAEDIRQLLNLKDEGDFVQTQQEIAEDYKAYLNSLDWKTGLTKLEVKKYKKMWNEICDAIVNIPLISDVLRLKIGINEKADFIHKLIILYGLPMDSFEFIQMRKSLLSLYQKYQGMHLSQQQIIQFSQLEKRMAEIAEYQSSLKYLILSSNLSEKNKSFVFSRYQQLLSEPDNGKLKVWINTALSIPTNIHENLTIKKLNPRNIDKYLCNIMNVLNEELYGMNNIKEQLLFFINNKLTKKDMSGAAIALEGLPGIGKTCIINALSKALDLPMTCIQIGGAKDSSFLTGFSYTYEGAQPGAIVQALQELKCLNGIIFIDEIDKIPHTDKGNEISKALLHIIDPSQNFAFHDKYLSNQFDIDLSKIWFIYTLNNRNDIERTLCDRIPIIKVSGYTFHEKCEIAYKYLIPRALKNMNISSNEIEFSLDSIRYLIHLLQEHRLEITDSDGRSGVRQLRYLIDHIVMKLNLLRNLWDPTQKYSPKLSLSFQVNNFKLPIVITPEIINQLGISEAYQPENMRHLSMYS